MIAALTALLILGVVHQARAQVTLTITPPSQTVFFTSVTQTFVFSAATTVVTINGNPVTVSNGAETDTVTTSLSFLYTPSAVTTLVSGNPATSTVTTTITSGGGGGGGGGGGSTVTVTTTVSSGSGSGVSGSSGSSSSNSMSPYGYGFFTVVTTSATITETEYQYYPINWITLIQTVTRQGDIVVESAVVTTTVTATYTRSIYQETSFVYDSTQTVLKPLNLPFYEKDVYLHRRY